MCCHGLLDISDFSAFPMLAGAKVYLSSFGVYIGLGFVLVIVLAIACDMYIYIYIYIYNIIVVCIIYVYYI